MRTSSQILIAFGLIVSVLLGYCGLRQLGYPKLINGRSSGELRVARSQDGNFLAVAGTYEDMGFWGNRTYFYQFEIYREGADRPIRVMRLFPSALETLTDFSIAGRFEWSADSLGVEIGYLGVELGMQAIEF